MWDFIKRFGKVEEDCIKLCLVVRSSHELYLSAAAPDKTLIYPAKSKHTNIGCWDRAFTH